MDVVRLADDRDDGRAGVQERPQVGVVLGAAARASGAAEGGDLCVLELERLRAFEELDVLRIGAGPAALDVVDA